MGFLHVSAQHIDSARVLLSPTGLPSLMVRASSGSSPLAIAHVSVAQIPFTEQIEIDICYYVGFADTLGGSRDTLALPQFLQTSYDLLIRTYANNQGYGCTATVVDTLHLSVGNRGTVFPNPAAGAFAFTLHGQPIREAWLIEATGRRIPAAITVSGDTGYATTDFRGMAILCIRLEGGGISSRLVEVQ
jgi:hypothetical protein